MVKKLLNLHEEATHLRLRKVCEKHGAAVHAKVRVADVLTVDRVSAEDRGFALTSHFDFVVTDSNHVPLFAVEFDGPSHKDATQQERDTKKNRICEIFGFPLLRINARYLPQRYRNMDLLSWFVEVWFLKQWFDDAQEEGSIPADEIFDPFFTMSSRPGENKPSFPLWLSQPLLSKIHRLWEAGRVCNPSPSHIVGQSPDGIYRAIAWIPITEDSAVYVETAMRAQRFPVLEADILSELIVFEVHERLAEVLAGRAKADQSGEVDSRIKRFQASTALCQSHFCAKNVPRDTFQ